MSTLESQRMNLGVSRLGSNEPRVEGGHKSRRYYLTRIAGSCWKELCPARESNYGGCPARASHVVVVMVMLAMV